MPLTSVLEVGARSAQPLVRLSAHYAWVDIILRVSLRLRDALLPCCLHAMLLQRARRRSVGLFGIELLLLLLRFENEEQEHNFGTLLGCFNSVRVIWGGGGLPWRGLLCHLVGTNA